MDLIRKIKRIEQYVVENFDELDLDDPIEEGYWEEYQEIPGASQKEIEAFEKKFSIKLPKDFKALYSYKNGSKYFSCNPWCGNVIFPDEFRADGEDKAIFSEQRCSSSRVSGLFHRRRNRENAG